MTTTSEAAVGAPREALPQWLRLALAYDLAKRGYGMVMQWPVLRRAHPTVQDVAEALLERCGLPGEDDESALELAEQRIDSFVAQLDGQVDLVALSVRKRLPKWLPGAAATPQSGQEPAEVTKEVPEAEAEAVDVDILRHALPEGDTKGENSEFGQDAEPEATDAAEDEAEAELELEVELEAEEPAVAPAEAPRKDARDEGDAYEDSIFQMAMAADLADFSTTAADAAPEAVSGALEEATSADSAGRTEHHFGTAQDDTAEEALNMIEDALSIDPVKMEDADIAPKPILDEILTSADPSDMVEPLLAFDDEAVAEGLDGAMDFFAESAELDSRKALEPLWSAEDSPVGPGQGGSYTPPLTSDLFGGGAGTSTESSRPAKQLSAAAPTFRPSSIGGTSEMP